MLTFAHTLGKLLHKLVIILLLVIQCIFSSHFQVYLCTSSYIVMYIDSSDDSMVFLNVLKYLMNYNIWLE